MPRPDVRVHVSGDVVRVRVERTRVRAVVSVPAENQAASPDSLKLLKIDRLRGITSSRAASEVGDGGGLRPRLRWRGRSIAEPRPDAHVHVSGDEGRERAERTRERAVASVPAEKQAARILRKIVIKPKIITIIRS